MCKSLNYEDSQWDSETGKAMGEIVLPDFLVFTFLWF